MRRLAVVIFSAVCATAMAACGSSSKKSVAGPTTTAPTTSTSTTPTTIPVVCNGTKIRVTSTAPASSFKPVTPDTLTVVTSLPAPGFWNGSDSDPTKLKSGYEYDIANGLKKAFGVHNVVVKNAHFDEIVAGTVKDYDVALSQTPIGCDRAKDVLFTSPYFVTPSIAIVKKGFDKPLATLDDAKELQWGALLNTVGDGDAHAINGKSGPKEYAQLSDAMTALQNGSIDALMVDAATGLPQVKASKGALKAPVEIIPPAGPIEVGAIVPADSTNGPAINGVLKQLKDNGALHRSAVKYLSADPATMRQIALQ